MIKVVSGVLAVVLLACLGLPVLLLSSGPGGWGVPTASGMRPSGQPSAA